MASISEQLFRATFAKIMASAKSSFPWQRDEPYSQPYFGYSEDKQDWQPVESSSSSSSSELSPPTSLAVITWNIDMICPLPDARMKAALNYLEKVCSTTHTGPLVILFQEMLVSDLEIIASSPWIQSRFYLTDLNDKFWEGGYYGTCSLIDKRLPIKSCFRVHYSATKMERDVLFVDVLIKPSSSSSPKTIRIGNTHLESLVADPPLRPVQLALAAQHMKDPSIDAAIIAGDMNAIQPFDRTLASTNGLEDVYISLGGHEDTQEGYTWGPQVPKELTDRFGSSRMDKILFCSKSGDVDATTVRVVGFGKVGAGVEVEHDDEKKELIAMEQGVEDQDGVVRAYVTDHLGLWAGFEFGA